MTIACNRSQETQNNQLQKLHKSKTTQFYQAIVSYLSTKVD